ncbi:MAG: hypothetical protein Kow0074_12900 [Candidatus Zixiibacteriota bacterium]
MATVCISISGGLWLSPAALAQGAIYGTVANSDMTHPSVSELSWFGFLDDTDEEIRIELNTGAGYDGLNWFDDFQNYTTEAAGNPYEFVFVNQSRNEAFVLSGLIPQNSFQEQNITLSAASIPAAPANLQAQVISPSAITLTWDAIAGLTYHIYRRDGLNNGIYRRIDDPTGNLANPGVAGPVFVDSTTDASSQYVYLLIAEDQTGNYSGHSAPLEVDTSSPTCHCPCQADINCDGAPTAEDLNATIDIIFFNAPEVRDTACPLARSDLDCNGFSDSLDLNLIIELVFFNGEQPCDPCVL